MNPEKYAEQLRKASETRTTIPPLRTEIGIENLDLAYKIQEINTQFRVNNGARIVGKKIGLTSFAVQKQLGVDQPDFGTLFHDKEILNGQSISVQEMLQPKVEAEIAFVLGEDLDIPDLGIIDLMSCIDYALPAMEIVGSRISDWNIKITDTIADNASASHFVVGHTPKTLDEFDVVHCQMKMFKGDVLVSEGTGADSLGSPLNATLWLANKMYQYGQPLQAGDLILSGALGPMCAVEAGDQFSVSIEGLGRVSVSFNE